MKKKSLSDNTMYMEKNKARVEIENEVGQELVFSLGHLGKASLGETLSTASQAETGVSASALRREHA